MKKLGFAVAALGLLFNSAFAASDSIPVTGLLERVRDLQYDQEAVEKARRELDEIWNSGDQKTFLKTGEQLLKEYERTLRSSSASVKQFQALLSDYLAHSDYTADKIYIDGIHANLNVIFAEADLVFARHNPDLTETFVDHAAILAAATASKFIPNYVPPPTYLNVYPTPAPGGKMMDMNSKEFQDAQQKVMQENELNKTSNYVQERLRTYRASLKILLVNFLDQNKELAPSTREKVESIAASLTSS